MELFYYVIFGVLSSIVAVFELNKKNKDRISTSSTFRSFKNNYLVVYSLMMGEGDCVYKYRRWNKVLLGSLARFYGL